MNNIPMEWFKVRLLSMSLGHEEFIYMYIRRFKVENVATIMKLLSNRTGMESLKTI